MGWTESIGAAINYIEEHLCEELTPEIIAQKAAVSPFYFQKGFVMLCGMSIGEYIRGRRLSLAGREIILTDRRIIDIALDYGYDSPDSFTKGIHPLPWHHTCRSKAAGRRSATVCSAETEN